LSSSIGSFIVIVVWVVVTGGLHLDGFGDACDGLFATVSPDRRLEIMKDSRAGSWAVIGLILLLLGKWTLLPGLSPLALVLPPILGRWAIVIAVALFPYGRADGVGAYFRVGFQRRHLLIASAMTVAAILLFAGFVDVRWLIFLLLIPGFIWLVGRWAAQRLGGGLTGDVYGALCELTELVVLLVLHL
jgi:adenosylcobinamide-GDP ribazoletransferase